MDIVKELLDLLMPIGPLRRKRRILKAMERIRTGERFFVRRAFVWGDTFTKSNGFGVLEIESDMLYWRSDVAVKDVELAQVQSLECLALRNATKADWRDRKIPSSYVLLYLAEPAKSFHLAVADYDSPIIQSLLGERWKC